MQTKACRLVAALAATILRARCDPDRCTSIVVGPAASTEGVAFAAHTNDCVNCDPRVARIPAKDHALGTKRPVVHMLSEYPRYVGSDRSETYAAITGQRNTEPLGYVGEVAHTFAYWEAAYPLMNEHGLGFSESTCAAKLVNIGIPDGGKALFCMESLMQVASERCATAVCAIETMGKLGERYGFYGGDPGMPGAGESLSIVDGSSAWVFHMTGGLENTSATWVGQRVPDTHVAVVANHFTIRKVNCSDMHNFRCSSNIFSNARAAKLCNFDSEADFDWTQCYAPDIRHFSYLPGLHPIPWYTTLRLWRIQSLTNPSLGLQPSDDPRMFAFSVPVLRPLSRRQVMDWMRDHYEGTAFDMTQGVLAGPFGNPYRLEGGSGLEQIPGQFARGISIPRTTYGLLVEAKPASKAPWSIAWLATDAPATSVFVPFFASANRCAAAYTKGHLEVFSRDSAWWAFNFLANWMNINYRNMSLTHVYPVRDAEQTRILQAVEAVEKVWPQETIDVEQLQTTLQEQLVSKWWQLGDRMIAAFSDGVYFTPDGKVESIGYPAWWLQMIGFNEQFFFPQWVQWTLEPPPLMLSSLQASHWWNRPLQLSQQAVIGPASVVPTMILGIMIGVLATVWVQSVLGRTSRSKRSDYFLMSA